MAQLERNPEGLRMSELSKRLMVSGGVAGDEPDLVSARLQRKRLLTNAGARPGDGPSAWR
jgi:hypothetical protein